MSETQSSPCTPPPGYGETLNICGGGGGGSGARFQLTAPFLIIKEEYDNVVYIRSHMFHSSHLGLMKDFVAHVSTSESAIPGLSVHIQYFETQALFELETLSLILEQMTRRYSHTLNKIDAIIANNALTRMTLMQTGARVNHFKLYCILLSDAQLLDISGVYRCMNCKIGGYHTK